MKYQMDNSYAKFTNIKPQMDTDGVWEVEGF